MEFNLQSIAGFVERDCKQRADQHHCYRLVDTLRGRGRSRKMKHTDSGRSLSETGKKLIEHIKITLAPHAVRNPDILAAA